MANKIKHYSKAEWVVAIVITLVCFVCLYFVGGEAVTKYKQHEYDTAMFYALLCVVGVVCFFMMMASFVAQWVYGEEKTSWQKLPNDEKLLVVIGIVIGCFLLVTRCVVLWSW